MYWSFRMYNAIAKLPKEDKEKGVELRKIKKEAREFYKDYDASIDDSSSIRSSTGIGMNLLTPVGPLSFSLTQPITKKSSDTTETFRFNLGTTF